MAQLTMGQVLDVLEQLRQAEWDLPAKARGLMADVRTCVGQGQFERASELLMQLFRAVDTPTEKMWLALAGVLSGTDKTDISPYVEYIQKTKQGSNK